MAKTGVPFFFGAFALLASMLLLVGCGGQRISTSQKPAKQPAQEGKLAFESPGTAEGGVIPAEFECEPGVWLPLRWGEVPKGTRELALYIGRFSNETVSRSRMLMVPAASLVLGLDPARDKIAAGEKPSERTFTAQFHPEDQCPARRNGQQFVFELFALSANQRIEPSSVNTETLTELTQNSLAIGRFTATYGRR